MFINKEARDLGWGSVVECLSSMHTALDLISSAHKPSIPVIPAFWRQSQENEKFKVFLPLNT